MQFEIKHIHERLGVTVVYVTHDQTEALTLSDRIAVFNDGVIQQLSSAEELYDQPQNAFVAQFIGENNKLRGTITATAKNQCEVKLDAGPEVRALNVAGARKGDRTLLSVRPESVEINASAKGTENRLDATVRELIFLGDHMRVRLAVAGNDDFIVKVRSKKAGGALKEGKQVKVGWQTADCRALDAPN
jgi:putative spermidine/putrescine transport system ATP-binding protein